MRRMLHLLNACFLFLTSSMYLGTGWSMTLFQFPVAAKLTPANYYLVFVPQVDAATRFFTVMTWLMIASSILMLVAEWRTGYRWAPAVVLAAVTAATALTIYFIFPYNRAMSEGIREQAELTATLNRWMSLNWVRVSLWTAQWLAMMTYFAMRVYRQAMHAAAGAPWAAGARA